MRKIAAILGLLGAAWSAQLSAAPIVVYFEPSTANIATSATNFGVDVKIRGLGTGVGKEIVSGFDLNVLFSPSILSGVGATENAAKFGFSSFGPFSNLPAGNLGLDGTSFESDSDLETLFQPEDSFVLATLLFDAVGVDGATILSFGSAIPFESNLLGHLDAATGFAQTLDVTFESACISVGAGTCRVLPEPASYALLSLALGAALLPRGSWRRRPVQAMVPPTGIEPVSAA